MVKYFIFAINCVMCMTNNVLLWDNSLTVSAEYNYDDGVWESESEDDDSSLEIDNGSVSLYTKSILLFFFIWQFIFNVSDAALMVLLHFMHCVLKVIHSITENGVIKSWVDHFPRTEDCTSARNQVH